MIEKNVLSNQDETSLLDIIKKVRTVKQIILAKWVAVAVISLATALLGLTYAWFITPHYTARLSFMLEEGNKGAISGAMAFASQLGLSGDVEGSNFNSTNILELLKSRKVIKQALLSQVNINNKTDLLINFYLDVNSSEKEKGKNLRFSADNKLPFSLEQNSTLNALCEAIISDALKVGKEEKSSSIIVVNFKSKDPLISKYFVEKLVQSVSDYYIANKTEKARQSLNFIQMRADSVQQALATAELHLARRKDSSHRLIKAEGALTELRLGRDVQILNAMYTEIVKQLEIAKITLLNQTPLVSVVDIPILPLKKEKKFSKKSGVIIGGFLGFIFSSSFIIISRKVSEILALEKGSIT